MLLLSNLSAFPIAKIALLLALAVVAVLWLRGLRGRPASRKNVAAPSQPALHDGKKPSVTAQSPRLRPGSEFTRLSGMIELAGSRVHAVHGATASAARHIDNAEMALDRLLREVAAVMPEAMTSTIVPRRALGAA